jgi:DNA-binding transcriptional MerR regulator
MGGSELLTIKDFARLTNVKESSLRYYDKLGLFSPAVRGGNSYRYYTPQQIITINALRLLHELDMPTREISELERNRTPERMMDVLAHKEAELEEEIRRLTSSYNVIRTFRKMIQKGLSVDETVLSVEYMEEQSIRFGPANEFSISGDFYHAFLKFCREADKHRVELRFPVGGFFPDMETYVASPSMPTHFFSIDPEGGDKKPSGKYLVAYARGNYGNTNAVERKMEAWLKSHKMRAKGPVYNIFLLDEISLTDPDQYLLQASVGVE